MFKSLTLTLLALLAIGVAVDAAPWHHELVAKSGFDIQKLNFFRALAPHLTNEQEVNNEENKPEEEEEDDELVDLHRRETTQRGRPAATSPRGRHHDNFPSTPRGHPAPHQSGRPNHHPTPRHHPGRTTDRPGHHQTRRHRTRRPHPTRGHHTRPHHGGSTRRPSTTPEPVTPNF